MFTKTTTLYNKLYLSYTVENMIRKHQTILEMHGDNHIMVNRLRV